MIIKPILIPIAVGLSLCSCGNDEPKYSCDEDVDFWIKEHLEEIHGMSRADWLDADPEFSIALYRAFTPKQKIEFWRNKFQEVKKLHWSEEEKAHIIRAEKYLESHVDFFDDGSLNEKQQDEVELFFYEWIETAKKDLGWEKETAYSIVASGNRVLDTKGTLETMTKSRSGAVIYANSEASCNCCTDCTVTCIATTYGSCEKAKCSETEKGCGFLFLSDCDGRCEEPEPVNMNNI